MKTQDGKSTWLPLIAGIAVILFSTAGIARMLGWGPNSGSSGGVAAATSAGEGRARPRCPECGVIVSMRASEGHEAHPGAVVGVNADSRDQTRLQSIRRSEITIRLADGSKRVIDHANPAPWRPGQRVIVIDGASLSNR